VVRTPPFGKIIVVAPDPAAYTLLIRALLERSKVATLEQF